MDRARLRAALARASEWLPVRRKRYAPILVAFLTALGAGLLAASPAFDGLRGLSLDALRRRSRANVRPEQVFG
jgi:hypothetical protein